MNRFDRAKIEKELADELARATAEYAEVERATRELIEQVPSGIPLSDGQLRIIRAGQKTRLAFRKYRETLTRYREFLAEPSLPPKTVTEIRAPLGEAATHNPREADRPPTSGRLSTKTVCSISGHANGAIGAAVSAAGIERRV